MDEGVVCVDYGGSSVRSCTKLSVAAGGKPYASEPFFTRHANWTYGGDVRWRKIPAFFVKQQNTCVYVSMKNGVGDMQACHAHVKQLLDMLQGLRWRKDSIRFIRDLVSQIVKKIELHMTVVHFEDSTCAAVSVGHAVWFSSATTCTLMKTSSDIQNAQSVYILSHTPISAPDTLTEHGEADGVMRRLLRYDVADKDSYSFVEVFHIQYTTSSSDLDTFAFIKDEKKEEQTAEEHALRISPLIEEDAKPTQAPQKIWAALSSAAMLAIARMGKDHMRPVQSVLEYREVQRWTGWKAVALWVVVSLSAMSLVAIVVCSAVATSPDLALSVGIVGGLLHFVACVCMVAGAHRGGVARPALVPGVSIVLSIVCFALFFVWVAAGLLHRVWVVTKDGVRRRSSVLSFFAYTRRDPSESSSSAFRLSERLARREGVRCVVVSGVFFAIGVLSYVRAGRWNRLCITVTVALLVVFCSYIVFDAVEFWSVGSMDPLFVPSAFTVRSGGPTAARALHLFDDPASRAVDTHATDIGAAELRMHMTQGGAMQLHGVHFDDMEDTQSIEMSVRVDGEPEQALMGAIRSSVLLFDRPVRWSSSLRISATPRWPTALASSVRRFRTFEAGADARTISVDGAAPSVRALLVEVGTKAVSADEHAVSSSFGGFHFWMHLSTVIALFIALLCISFMLWKQRRGPP